MLAVTIAALVTLGPAGDARLEADLQATQTTRSTVTVGGADLARAELALAPQLALETDGRLRLRFAYLPSLLVPADLAGESSGASGPLDERSAVMHRATARADYPVRVWRLHGGGTLGVGDTLLVTELTTTAGRGQPVSTTERIPYFVAEATAGVAGEPTRRTALALTAGISHSGGDSAAARERLPLREEVRFAATAARSVTPRHALGVDLEGSRSRLGMETEGDAGFLRGGASWAYRHSPRTGLRTVAGLALTYQREGPNDPSWMRDVPTTMPWWSFTADYVPGSTRPSARLELAVEPVVDRFTGAIDLRGGGSATLGWAPFRQWLFAMRGSSSSLFDAGAGTPWISTGPHTAVDSVGVSAAYQLTETLRLTATAASTYQTTEREDLPQFREDLLAVELTTRVFSL